MVAFPILTGVWVSGYLGGVFTGTLWFAPAIFMYVHFVLMGLAILSDPPMTDDELIEFRLRAVAFVFMGNFVGAVVSWTLSLPVLFPVSIKDLTNRGTLGTSLLTISLMLAITGFVTATGTINKGFGEEEAVVWAVLFVLIIVAIVVITILDPPGRLWYPLKMRYYLPTEDHRLTLFYAVYVILLSVPQALYDFNPDIPWWPGLVTLAIQFALYAVLAWIYVFMNVDSDRFLVPARTNVSPVIFVVVTGSIHLMHALALIITKETHDGDIPIFTQVNGGLTLLWIALLVIYWAAVGSRTELSRQRTSYALLVKNQPVN